jgi:toxin ParE1/3/4
MRIHFSTICKLSFGAIPFNFSAEARLDAKDATDWYELQQQGLGKKFKAALREAILRIKNNPYHASIKYVTVRTAVCMPFPYAVHYEIDELNAVVRVISIFHFSRRPGWM